MPARWTKPFAVPPEESGPTPIAWGRVERHVFGLSPRGLVASLAATGLAVAVALLALGHLVAGLVLLAVGLALAALWAEQALRFRESRLDRAAATAAERARDLAGLAGVAARAWIEQGRRVAALRIRARVLARRRRPLLLELGRAAYRDDPVAVAELRRRLRELELQVEHCAEQERSVRAATRDRIRRERLAVQATEAHPPLA